MLELYVHLFETLERNVDMEQWRCKNTALHDALHWKLPNAKACPVCEGSRLRQDTRNQGEQRSLRNPRSVCLASHLF
jgi:hypothetical protein